MSTELLYKINYYENGFSIPITGGVDLCIIFLGPSGSYYIYMSVQRHFLTCLLQSTFKI